MYLDLYRQLTIYIIYFMVLGFFSRYLVNIYFFKNTFTLKEHVVNVDIVMFGFLNFLTTACLIYFLDVFSDNTFDVIKLFEGMFGYYQSKSVLFYMCSVISTFVTSILTVLQLKLCYKLR